MIRQSSDLHFLREIWAKAFSTACTRSPKKAMLQRNWTTSWATISTENLVILEISIRPKRWNLGWGDPAYPRICKKSSPTWVLFRISNNSSKASKRAVISQFWTISRIITCWPIPCRASSAAIASISSGWWKQTRWFTACTVKKSESFTNTLIQTRATTCPVFANFSTILLYRIYSTKFNRESGIYWRQIMFRNTFIQNTTTSINWKSLTGGNSWYPTYCITILVCSILWR